MDFVGDIGSFLLFAQETAGGEEEEGGSFLVSPELGLMIWTLLLFGATLVVLNKLVFPRISEALDRRSRAIEESIGHAERTRREADELLEEYRARLREAREQAEDIVVRARKASDSLQDQAKADATKQREELLAATRRDIEAETGRALDELRQFADALAEDRNLQVFFFSPYFSSEEKKEGVTRVVTDADQRLVNFLQLLAERHRVPALFRIRRSFDSMWAEENKLLPVTVTSAVELDESLVQDIGRSIEEQTGRRVELSSKVDPDVLGGLQVRVGNMVLDATVRNRLEQLRKQVARAAA